MQLEKKDNVNLQQQKDPNIAMLIAQIYKIKYNVHTKKVCSQTKINFKNIFKIVQELGISKKKKTVFGIIKI